MNADRGAAVHCLLDLIFGTIQADDFGVSHGRLKTETVRTDIGAGPAGNTFFIVKVKRFGHEIFSSFPVYTGPQTKRRFHRPDFGLLQGEPPLPTNAIKYRARSTACM
jgi:hypothetical protein